MADPLAQLQEEDVQVAVAVSDLEDSLDDSTSRALHSLWVDCKPMSISRLKVKSGLSGQQLRRVLAAHKKVGLRTADGRRIGELFKERFQ